MRFGGKTSYREVNRGPVSGDHLDCDDFLSVYGNYSQSHQPVIMVDIWDSW